jgi:two-component system chemotaxis response regulator CheV
LPTKIKNNTNQFILLVDDEDDILHLFCEYLASAGYNIASFNNPIDALNYLYKEDEKNLLANCLLVITDYTMPQMLGLDFLKKIREKDITFKIKIILISAFITSDLNVDDISKNLKIDKVIEKPIHLENLKNEIQKLLVN